MSLDLEAIRERADRATEGPWSPVVGASGESFWVEHPSTADVANEVVRWRDAEFIAHARTDVPALLAEVERLRGEVAELTCDEYCLYGRELNEARARIERVRSAIRLISPDHITPQGASILNAALADPKGEA